MVVSFSLDECPASVEQSVRVEPSPERIYTLPSCAEEDETMSPLSASSSKCCHFTSTKVFIGDVFPATRSEENIAEAWLHPADKLKTHTDLSILF